MRDVKLVGILNVTPDSFSDGGAYFSVEKALAHAHALIKDGASIIDVGGESTRPGAKEIEADEEWERVGEIVAALVEKYPRQISLDTRHTENAEKFFKLGGLILNNVSGFQDPVMSELAAQFCATCILNHYPGENIHQVHETQIDDICQVRDELLMQKAFMVRAGIDPDRIILDPGIGFGKTMALNRQLLCFSELLPEENVLIGHSRKRFLGDNRFDPGPNIEAAKTAIAFGAKYLRVHDPLIYRDLLNNQ